VHFPKLIMLPRAGAAGAVDGGEHPVEVSVTLSRMPPRPQLLPELLRGTPFRAADARALGVTRRRLQGPTVRRLHRGVYVDRTVPDTPALRAAAALLVLPPGSVLSHRTAATLRNLPLPEAEEDLVHAYVPGAANPGIAGIRAHRSATALSAERVRGLPVTTAARVWCDLAADLDRRSLAILGDAILRGGRTTLADLAAEVECVRRGGRLARAVLPLLRGGVDSPPETVLRLLIIDAGLPEPVVNRPVFDASGGWIACPDLQYPRFRVAIEYEGEHHRTPDQQRRDIRRDELYQEEGWILLKVTHADLHLRPGALLERIRRALRAGGMS
jgi:hypothetical protein